MKSMTCKQLGGACDKKFHANSFEEMAELSKKHGMEMAKVSDPAHLKAMEEMQDKMKDPKAINTWLKNKRKEFDSLFDNE